MTKTQQRRPVLGCAFDPDQMNEAGRIDSYVDELTYYRPRGFSKLAKEGAAMLRSKKDDALDFASDWMNDCDYLLTEWARRVERNEYVSFGPFPWGGAIGFYCDAESAQSDADLNVSDLAEVPKGFSGLVVLVNDHGNVTALQFSRGKSRELFSDV